MTFTPIDDSGNPITASPPPAPTSGATASAPTGAPTTQPVASSTPSTPSAGPTPGFRPLDASGKPIGTPAQNSTGTAPNASPPAPSDPLASVHLGSSKPSGVMSFLSNGIQGSVGMQMAKKAWDSMKGFAGDVGNTAQDVGNKVTDIASDHTGVKDEVGNASSAFVKGFRTTAAVAGGINDVFGAAMNRLGVSGAVGGEVNNMADALDIIHPGSKEGLQHLASGAMDKYNAWKLANPETAKNVEDTAKIVSAIPLVEGGVSAVGGASKAIADAAPRIVEKAGQIATAAKEAAGTAVGQVKEAVGSVLPHELSPEEALNKSADTYRQVLNLGKAQAKITQKAALSGGQIVDLPTEMAREQLPITTDSVGKLDTTEARKIVQERMSNISDQHLSKAIGSDTTQWHSLDDAVAATKEKVAAGSGTATYKKTIMSNLDQHLADEKELAGLKPDEEFKTTGTQAQQMKKSLQREANYDRNAPQASNDSKTALASTLRQNLEDHYASTADLKAINQQTQKYVMMDRALGSVHGQVVRGGMLGKMINRGIGAVVGSGIPIVGPLAGQEIAGRLTDYMLNPERLTSQAAERVARAGIETGEQTAARLATNAVPKVKRL